MQRVGVRVGGGVRIGSTSVRACSVYLALFHHLSALARTARRARLISLRRRFGLALSTAPSSLSSLNGRRSLSLSRHTIQLYKNTQKQICRSFA